MDENTPRPSGGAGASAAAGAAPGRVLLVDDEVALTRSLARFLKRANFECTLASSADEALHKIMAARYDVIVTDIHMPGTSGVDLLRVVRAYDLDVPVILMTGGPDVASAIQAVELGALLYLCKPFDMDQLVRAVSKAAKLHAMARLKREGLRLLGQEDRAGVAEGLSVSLDGALRSLSLALQPIVSVRSQRIFAYEALMRSSEPSLACPGDVLDAAERLDRVHEVGRAVRVLAAEALNNLPHDVLLFVNLHPKELLDKHLTDASSALAQSASRVVLEITERASLEDVPDTQARVSVLRQLGYRFALDDLGAGHAGLGGFTKCEPEFVKLDMSLTRNIHQSPARKRLFRGLYSLAVELDATVIAEGVELTEERDVLAAFGCDYMQGYFFAKPAFQPSEVHWGDPPPRSLRVPPV